MRKYKVLSIDAWAEGESWTWNNWFHVDDYDEKIDGELSDDNALKFLLCNFIKEKYWTDYEIEDDQYNIVLINKESRKPIVAIEYGSQL